MEFLRVDNKIILGKLAQISLKIETTFLDEDLFFVTNTLLGWNLWEHNTWPSFLKTLVKDEELIVASLTLPFSLEIFTLYLINNVAMEVLWVLDREI